MDLVFRLLMVFEAVVCFLLIGIVLMQRSKGQGAGLSFGGGAEAVFGAQMGNVLTRATVVLAVLFLANTTLLTVLRPSARGMSLGELAARGAAAPAPAAVPGALSDELGFEQRPDGAEALLDAMIPELPVPDSESGTLPEEGAEDTETVAAEASAPEADPAVAVEPVPSVEDSP